MAKAQLDIRSLARAHTETCIRTLAGIVRQKGAPAAARVIAANSLIDRGWGKAPLQLTGEDGGEIRVTIRQIIVNAVQSIVDDEPKVIEHDEDEVK